MSKILDALRRSQPGGAATVVQLPSSERHTDEELPPVPDMRVHEVKLESVSRLPYYTDPTSLASDRFRYLRVRLREIWRAGKLKTLLITSPLPQDGKSTIAMNLATALAERGSRKLLLIDADMHRSSLSETFGLAKERGLAESLEGGVDTFACIRRLEPLGWYLLPAGETPANPTELLQPEAVSGLLRKLLPHFEWILIDSPPVMPITDAISLTHHADGVLLVARADRTSGKVLEETIGLIGRKNVLALAVNAVEGMARTYSQYYGRYSNKYGGEKEVGSTR